MLSDWYFCTCIGSSPEQTNSFLSILEALDDPHTDLDLLSITFRELGRTDIWMHIYALPRVFSMLQHRNLPQNLLGKLNACYLSDILEILPTDIAQGFDNLFAELLTNKSLSDQLAALTLCASQLDKNGAHRQTTRRPYLDIREYTPEVILLSAIDHIIEKNPSTVPFIRQELGLEQNGSDFGQLIQESLSYTFGRFPLLLAVTVLRKITNYEMLPETRIKVKNILSQVSDANISIEPDLMSSYAEICYLSSASDDKEILEKQVSTVLEETIAQTAIPEQLQGGRLAVEPGAIFGEMQKDDQMLLPLIYWQMTLWELACKINSVLTAKTLGKMWRLSEAQPPSNISVSRPKSVRNVEYWISQLVQLAAIHFPKKRNENLTINIQNSPSNVLEDRTAWIFAAPALWLSVRALDFNPAISGRGRYPSIVKPPVFIRLLVGAYIAVKLLERTGDSPLDLERRNLAALLVHTADVIEVGFADLLKEYRESDVVKDDKVKEKLSFPMTGLLLFVDSQIRLAGQGNLTSIPPDLFTSLLESPQGPGNINAHNYGVQFRTVVAPQVIVNWIANCMPGAIPKDPSVRWLGLIQDVFYHYPYDLYRDRRYAYDGREKFSLLVRFFFRDAFDPQRIVDMNWRDATFHQTEPAQWRVRSRWILLTAPLSPNEWCPDWMEPEIDRGQILARAIERLSTLTHLEAPTPETKKSWMEQWVNAMNAIVTHKQLDRFTRLRLLEFLDEPILQDDYEGQELIASILVEHGGPFELNGLLDRIYIRDTGEYVQEARKRLRLSLLQVLESSLVISQTKVEQAPNAQSPRRTQESLIRSSLLCEYLVWIAASPKADKELKHELRRLRNQRIKQDCDREISSEELDVEVVNGIKRVTPNDLSITRWNIRGLVYDPNKTRLAVHYIDLDEIPDTSNLFTFKLDEQRTFISQMQGIKHLVAIVTDKRGSTNEPNYTFDIGLWFDLNKRLGDPLLQIGDFARIPIASRPDPNNPQRPRIEIANGQIQKIQPKWPTLSLNQLKLETRYDNDHRSIRLFCGDQDIWENVDLQLWVPDRSIFYRPVSNGKSEQIVEGVLKEDGKWTPLDRTLLDLFLVFSAPDYDQDELTLIFVNNHLDHLGKPCWRFSRQPGENYLLYPDDFYPDDVGELTKELNPIQEGLLLTVQILVTQSGRYLKLFRSPGEMTAREYVHLNTPFDRRNLDWQKIFENKDGWIALLDRGIWWIDLPHPIPGYPERVRVDWGNNPPSRDRGGRVSITNVEWIPNKHCVQAEWEWHYYCNLPDDRLEFWNHWYSLDTNDVVTLARVGSGKAAVSDDGQIICFTSDGMRIYVDAETLSMKAWKPPLPISRERVAKVRYIKKFEPIQLDLDWMENYRQLPDTESFEGILIDVPAARTKDALCKVLWKVGEHLVEGQVTIHHPTPQIYSLGTLLTAKREAEKYIYSAHGRLIFARALWGLENYRPEKRVTYLGLAQIGQDKQAVAESEPGKLMLMPATSPTTPILSNGAGCVFNGGLSQDKVFDNSAKDPSRRARLDCGGGLILCGASRGRFFKSSKVQIQYTTMTLRVASDGDTALYDLAREFIFINVSLPSPKFVQEDVYRQNLVEYFTSEPRNLPGRYSAGYVDLYDEFYIPIDPQKNQWSKKVPIATGQGTYIESNEYSLDAMVQLIKDGENILGSFRKVRPWTLEDYVNEHDEIILGEQSVPTEKLYYAGFVGVDEDAYISSETRYRFEWGYGKTIVVSENQLMYQGGPFKEADMLLFFGDLITEIIFHVSESDDSDPLDFPNSSKSHYSMNIVGFAFSDGHKLYSQKTENIVHRLHLVKQPGKIRIIQVDGIEEGSLDDSPRGYTIQSTLSETSHNRLLSENWGASFERVIMGRLQKSIYEETRGKSIVFEHVRLSFSPGTANNGIFNNELLFLRALKIENKKNDIGLRLGPPNSMLPSDIGDDMKELLILRRQFSVREDLLERLGEDERNGIGRVHDREVLVKFEEEKNRKSASQSDAGEESQIYATMLHGISRSEHVLRRAIENNHNFLFANILWINSEWIVLELKPGIFVRILSKNLEQPEQTLESRDMIRIENRPQKRFAIIRVTPSHRRYLPDGVRPALALPKNTMFSRTLFTRHIVHQDTSWLDKDFNFSIAGIPGLLAKPGNYSVSSGWSRPTADRFIQLMQKQHPYKIVEVGLDSSGSPRISAMSTSSWIAGYLKLDANNLDLPEFIPFDDEEAHHHRMEWRFISFADQSAHKIQEELTQESWHYHDKSTGYWVHSDQDFRYDRQIIGAQTACTGPLFISTKSKEGLRYQTVDFERIGFPVQELIRSIYDHENKRKWYTVAGISSMGGIWLEIQPGRIVEVPGQMLVWATLNGVESISTLNWQVFAPGDQIELELDSMDPLIPDRLILRDWKAGIRSMAGKGQWILPVDHFNRVEGALHLGRGRYQIVLPMSEFSDDWRMVALSADNYLENADQILPRPGDAMLLGIDDTDGFQRPAIIGFSEWTVRIDDQAELLSGTYSTLGGQGQLDLVIALLDAIGGVLPVTVESVDQRARRIYISRKNQSLSDVEMRQLADHTLLLHPLGTIGNDGQWIILESGKIIWKAKFDEVISGIPDDPILRKRAAELLPKVVNFIWMRLSSAGSPIYRLANELSPDEELLVRAVAFVEGETDNGFICQSTSSSALYWLPEEQLAWAELQPYVWEKMLPLFSQIPLHARLIPSQKTKLLSVIQTRRSARELATLSVGRELVVDIISRISPAEQLPNLYLARSFVSGAMLTVISHSSLPDGEKSVIVAEITRKRFSGHLRVIAAPANERPQLIDLPNYVLSPKATSRTVHLQQRLLTLKEARFPSANNSTLTTLSTLSDQLVFAYGLESQDPKTLEIEKNIALEWKKINIFLPEMDAAEALMDVLVLARTGLALDAFILAENICWRALRSMHCEVLSSIEKPNADWRSRRENMMVRLTDILDERLVRPLQVEDVNLIFRYCQAVQTSQLKEYIPSAVGLLAAIGKPVDVRSLHQNAYICHRLIGILNSLASDNNHLTQVELDKFELILRQLLDSYSDIVLLDVFLLQPSLSGT